MATVKVAIITITGLPRDCYPGGVRVATYAASTPNWQIVQETCKDMCLTNHKSTVGLERYLCSQHGNVEVFIERGHEVKVEHNA